MLVLQHIAGMANQFCFCFGLNTWLNHFDLQTPNPTWILELKLAHSTRVNICLMEVLQQVGITLVVQEDELI
jgi:hypothetical protein